MPEVTPSTVTFTRRTGTDYVLAYDYTKHAASVAAIDATTGFIEERYVLTPEEVGELYSFVRNKSVEEIDDSMIVGRWSHKLVKAVLI